MIPDYRDLIARAELGNLRMIACPVAMYDDPLPTKHCSAPRHLDEQPRTVPPMAAYVVISADVTDADFSAYWLWCLRCWTDSELPIETIIGAQQRTSERVD